MGQILKRKRKGRPPKSDLARRELGRQPEPESRARRSLRRRNVRYNFVDYDDFIDDEEYLEDDEEEDEEAEEEDEPRRGKKVKLVVKLNQGAREAHAQRGGAWDEEEEEDDEAERDGEEEEDDDDDRRRKVVKKRRISLSCSREDDAEEEENEEHRGGIDEAEEWIRPEMGVVKEDAKELDSPPGTPPRPACSVPLPDKKKLELILDKLQKKDIYGVYAEPVDPEELPDYHDVIEHPMDFSTVRKKLANGLYSTLEQLESDVFLICSNAMLYNAPDTIYHKQARTIQELGRKKFQKLRTDYERSERERKLECKMKSDFDNPEKELRTEQRMKSSPLVKKQMKRPMSRTFPEPMGSDFSAGATPGSAGDLQSVFEADQVGNFEVPSTRDGVLDGSPLRAENNLDKVEEMSTGKGTPAKFWRKPSAVDENRRATYNTPSQPILRVESIFTTFEDEAKQLVAVGLHAENSYARSLARFAAALGPIAWKVASQRIEQVLPAGSKYGHGWVGEYEPLPTPILMPEKRFSENCSLAAYSHSKIDSRNDLKTSAPPREGTAGNSVSETKPSQVYQNSLPSTVNSSGSRQNVANPTNHQQPQSPASRNPTGSSRKVVKQFELNSLPPICQSSGDYPAEKKHSDNSDAGSMRTGVTKLKNLNQPHLEVSVPEIVAPRTKEMVANSKSGPQSTPFKQQDSCGVLGRGISSGKILNNGFQSDGLPNEMQGPPGFFPRQDQGLSDPVQLMRMLAEKSQKQQNPQKQSSDNASAMASPVPPMRRDTSGNASTAAASVWMSVGGSDGSKQATGNPSSIGNQNTTGTDSPSSSPHNPVQFMQVSVEKAQKQQNPQKHLGGDTRPMTPQVPSTRKDTSGNASTAAASVWMSIGGCGSKQVIENSSSPRNQTPITMNSPYCSPRDRIHGQFHASSGVTYFQGERSSSLLPPPFMQQRIPSNEVQFSNQPMVFPQVMNANLARFQAQTPWKGLAPHTQQKTRPKQETLPPDLNIGFQSPGSPARQSSGMKVEQQPDLALQL